MTVCRLVSTYLPQIVCCILFKKAVKEPGILFNLSDLHHTTCCDIYTHTSLKATPTTVAQGQHNKCNYLTLSHNLLHYLLYVNKQKVIHLY